MAKSEQFTFDGGAATYIGTAILGWIITVVTFGIGYPWSLCMFHKWRTKHTMINGRRLIFTGGGFSLIGLWIKWMILTFLTFGIYFFWVIPSLNKWVVEHTDFEDEAKPEGDLV